MTVLYHFLCPMCFSSWPNISEVLLVLRQVKHDVRVKAATAIEKSKSTLIQVICVELNISLVFSVNQHLLINQNPEASLCCKQGINDLNKQIILLLCILYFVLNFLAVCSVTIRPPDGELYTQLLQRERLEPSLYFNSGNKRSLIGFVSNVEMYQR